MSPELPLVIRLTRAALARHDRFCTLVRARTRTARVDAALAFHAFAFKASERAFARTLLAQRSQLWLFRANQRAFCGDFVAIDMSSPSPERRRAFVVELKANMPLCIDGGPVGVQLRNAELALRSLAREGLVAEDTPWTTLAGDARQIVLHLERMRPPGERDAHS